MGERDFVIETAIAVVLLAGGNLFRIDISYELSNIGISILLMVLLDWVILNVNLYLHILLLVSLN